MHAGAGGVTWYAARYIPQKERLAVRALLFQGIDVLWPHYLAQVRHGTRRGYALRSWFQPYLFVSDGPSFSGRAVNKTMGISTLLYVGDQLMTIPEELIWDIKSIADPRGCIPAFAAKHRPKDMKDIKGANLIEALEELRDLKRKVWAGGIAATDRALTSKLKIAC